MGFKSLVLILVLMALAIADKRTLDMSKPGKSLTPLKNAEKGFLSGYFTPEEYSRIFQPAVVGILSIVLAIASIHIYKRCKTQEVKTRVLFGPKKQQPLSKTKSDLIAI